MTGMRAYILSIIAASILCGVVSSFLRSSAQRQSVRFLCGVCMIITVIGPLKGMAVMDLSTVYWDIQESVEEYTELGAKMSQTEYSDEVKANVERYVEDLGREWNTSIEAEIYLDEETFLPKRITVYGTVPEEVRANIEGTIQQELGIPVEEQMWLS